MSHIVTVTTQVRDPAGLRAACDRLRLPPPSFGTARLFSGEVAGYRVQLPDWRYAVVCDTGSGHVHFDNYGGRWGEQRHLDALLQAYAVEKAKIEARRQGHTVTEQPAADGAIKLTVQVGEAA